MGDEILYPQTIDPTPLPTVTGALEPASTPTPQSDNPNTISPAYIPPQTFPEKFVAPAVISDSINTLSKQILGDFSFGLLGAISIGVYQNGVSGEIKISPNGIVATNVNGITTFTIDGATGAATFLGTIQAGSFVAGDSSVLIDGNAGAGRIVIFTSGVPSIVMGNV